MEWALASMLYCYSTYINQTALYCIVNFSQTAMHGITLQCVILHTVYHCPAGECQVQASSGQTSAVQASFDQCSPISFLILFPAHSILQEITITIITITITIIIRSLSYYIFMFVDQCKRVNKIIDGAGLHYCPSRIRWEEMPVQIQVISKNASPDLGDEQICISTSPDLGDIFLRI